MRVPIHFAGEYLPNHRDVRVEQEAIMRGRKNTDENIEIYYTYHFSTALAVVALLRFSIGNICLRNRRV